MRRHITKSEAVKGRRVIANKSHFRWLAAPFALCKISKPSFPLRPSLAVLARDRHAVLAPCSARRANLSPLGLPKALLFKHAWQASPSHACTPSASNSLFPMETGQTVRESALHAGRQAWWPLDAMACSLGDTTTSGGGGGGGGFLLGWDPQLSYFGLGAWGAGTGDLDSYQRELELVVPKCKSNSLCTST